MENVFLVEQEALIYIIKELPKMGISYARIERENEYITERTLRNYANGKTRPKEKKFNYLIKTLKEKYPIEYAAAIAKFE